MVVTKPIIPAGAAVSRCRVKEKGHETDTVAAALTASIVRPVPRNLRAPATESWSTKIT